MCGAATNGQSDNFRLVITSDDLDDADRTKESSVVGRTPFTPQTNFESNFNPINHLENGPSSLTPTLDQFLSAPVNRHARNVAVLLFVAGGLAILGSFPPFITATAGLFQLSRNAFQLGPGLSIDFHGPLLIACGGAFVFMGLRATAVVKVPSLKSWEIITVSLLAALVTVDAWFGSIPGVTTTPSVGGFISVAGAVCGLVAYFINRNS